MVDCAAQVVKLSDAVQRLPRQQTQFVHGVPESFLEVGAAKAAQPASPDARRFGKGAYFIGKVRMPMPVIVLRVTENQTPKSLNVSGHIRDSALPDGCVGDAEDGALASG